MRSSRTSLVRPGLVSDRGSSRNRDSLAASGVATIVTLQVPAGTPAHSTRASAVERSNFVTAISRLFPGTARLELTTLPSLLAKQVCHFASGRNKFVNW